MINKKWLEGLLHEKYSLTKTEDTQNAINEIMKNLNAAVEIGRQRSKENETIDYLAELLREPGADLRLNNYILVFNQFNQSYSILNMAQGIEELYLDDVNLCDVLKIMKEE